MKRLLFLSFIIIVTFCMTLMAYASTGIESVLAAVKSKITVPEDYTIFESSSHEFAGKTEWNFWWRTQEQNGKAANEISVTADSQEI